MTPGQGWMIGQPATEDSIIVLPPSSFMRSPPCARLQAKTKTVMLVPSEHSGRLPPRDKRGTRQDSWGNEINGLAGRTSTVARTMEPGL
ncbi:hypothetical protein BDV30DRAFT_201800 [Aspergillus minisclerotigenes]|uniref:Uncharacterized protein n=1 Tax=Aspergillus minisclerotigenes TaxID=656917 RepID=A0A5N6JNZ8_9EURO|nr:hypothetical protein BDV30DRAFT_201800 [Aspergillus minisclerotigenes]